MLPDLQARRPSALWAIVAVASLLIAGIVAYVGYSNQRQATTPIGEGQLFVRDATAALAMVDVMDDPAVAVRQIRNDLRIEAVSYVTEEGQVAASTSATLVDTSLGNEVLAFGLAQGRFVAVAVQVGSEILIDGVVEWREGDVLYRVLQPTEGGGVLLDYDISELLARRSSISGVTEDTIRLALTAFLFVAIAAGALLGRSRTARHNRELAREAELMQHHNAELSRTNRQLDAARGDAERALALAEEKNRVRAEFVLMINHELRTPLTAVVTGARILNSEETVDPAARQEILDAMVLDGARLEQIIDQMLAVARIENRGLNLELAPLAGEDVCADVVSRHPDLSHQEHYEQLPVAISDRATLTQLIHSLVDNARTHGAQSVELECTAGVPFEPHIEVGHRPVEPLTFVISDDGPGIEREFLPRLFEKYEKDSFSSGTGLGLYLARMMVEALGGSIAVATSPFGTRMAVSVEAGAAHARIAAQ